jgi:hypothetical protein
LRGYIKCESLLIIFHMGVRNYQKVENRCLTPFRILSECPIFFYLISLHTQIAIGHVENNEPDVILRLVAYNGTILQHLDEKFSQLQNNLNNSKLLNDFAEKRFTVCYGLAKLPRRTQVKKNGNEDLNSDFSGSNSCLSLLFFGCKL